MVEAVVEMVETAIVKIVETAIVKIREMLATVPIGTMRPRAKRICSAGGIAAEEVIIDRAVSRRVALREVEPIQASRNSRTV